MKGVKVERQRLNSELKNILKYHISIIEAPIGYGKTTAVKDYVAITECNAFYINFLSEKNVLPFFWNSFSEVIEKIDRAASDLYRQHPAKYRRTKSKPQKVKH